MNSLSNDTYVQRTEKGDLALIAKPPIEIKLRSYLHEIPNINEIYGKEDLVNLSKLYITLGEKNPYEFKNIVDEIIRKGWVTSLPDAFVNSFFTNNEVRNLEQEENNNIEPENNDEVEDQNETKEKDLSEWLLEEKLRKEAEEEAERKKQEEEVGEEIFPELPWDKPYQSLEDFLGGGQSSTPQIEINVTEEVEFSDKYDQSWKEDHPEDTSNYSKSKSQRLQEQLTIMKKDKTKKTSVSKTEKSGVEDDKKNKGLLGRFGSLFKKGE